MATKPGDGKTSPYGDGKGGTGMSRAGANNFLTNPRGGNSGSGKAFDQTKQPKPTASPGTGPNPDDAAKAGLIPQIDPPDAVDIGTRPLGQNSKKPFKLGA
jgi:hypothetical protein